MRYLIFVDTIKMFHCFLYLSGLVFESLIIEYHNIRQLIYNNESQ